MNKLETVFAGFSSGGFAALCTNPIDVVKTNLMVDKTKYFKNYFHCMRFLYQENGMRAFTRGITYRTCHVGLMSIVFFSFYEHLLNLSIRKIAK